MAEPVDKIDIFIANYQHQEMTISDFQPNPAVRGTVTSGSASKGSPNVVAEELPSGETIISGAMPTTLGRRLAAVREHQKLTQGELARRLGKSRATINQYEAGTIDPPLKMVHQLAEVLGVDPGSLAFGAPVNSRDDGNRIPIAVIQASDDNLIELSEYLENKIGINPSQSRVIELSSDASTFGLRRGDLVFLDSSINRIRGDGSLYAVCGHAGGLMIIRSDVHLEANFTRVRITLGQGQVSEVDPAKVEVLGLIKATLRAE